MDSKGREAGFLPFLYLAAILNKENNGHNLGMTEQKTGKSLGSWQLCRPPLTLQLKYLVLHEREISILLMPLKFFLL